MKIVNGFELIEYAKKHALLLPAFNTTNLEMTYAITKGLNKAGLPGFIQISSNNLRLSNPATIVAITADALKDSDVPIALHLDHGKSYEDVKACLNAGFTSVMIDASHLDFEENIALVRKTADYCHFYGVPVEAELGALAGKEDEDVSEADRKTDPALVAEFVARSGCDTLAVSIGNVHGLDAIPNIDLPLLERISKVSPVPLVMHGGSGIDMNIIHRLKDYGMIKVNYGAELRKQMIRAFGETYERNHNAHDVISLSMKAVEYVSDKAAELVTEINR